MALLGAHFDIHTGGVDLSRIHHANEIAQSEPITGKPWVNYWAHSEFLVEKSGEKMSKSSGEFLTLSVLKKRNYDPMAYRYMILLGHYQSQLVFSWESLESAAAGYKNIVRKVADLLNSQNQSTLNSEVYGMWHDKILAIVSENVKTAEALVQIQELLKDSETNPATKIELFRFIDRLLGLDFLNRAEKLLKQESVQAPDEIQKLADERFAAKAAKDWGRADELRDQIDAAGWTVLDTKDGFKIIQKVL